MADEATFAERMNAIAADFLQTVVIVDDRGLERPKPPAEVEEPGPITESDPPSAEDMDEVVELIVPDSEAGNEDDIAHALDGKQLIDAFAECGLVCGVIDPALGEEETVIVTALQAGRRSDLLILDWYMLGQYGTIALDILDSILGEAAGDTKRRLRLVAIYTGERDLAGIVEAVASRLGRHYPDCALSRKDSFTLDKGPVRVVVLAKPHAQVTGQDRRVPFGEMPSRLIEEFALFCRGIVRAVGLACLAALRRDTHRLLHVLEPALDVGYLSDRARLPRPAEGERQLLEIVVGELRSILEDNEVTAIAQLPGLKAWLRAAVDETDIGTAIDPHGFRVEQLLMLLKTGVSDDKKVQAAIDAGIGLPKNGKGTRKVSNAFSESPEAALAADERYADRVLSRSHYGRPQRQLDLGTIVVDGDGEYMLCMQPQCDAAGLARATQFPFLPLKAVSYGQAADFIVQGADRTQLRLALQRKPSRLRQFQFDPGETGTVLALSDNTRHTFTTSDGVSVHWVTQLRPSFAQRAAHELGHQFSRVAVDDPESLRLSRR